jgi:hypothetical protein
MATKRGNGEGSISFHEKTRLYMARYTVQTATGPKRKTLYGKTRAEANQKLIKAMANRDAGLTFDADNLKVGHSPHPAPGECEGGLSAHSVRT